MLWESSCTEEVTQLVIYLNIYQQVKQPPPPPPPTRLEVKLL